MSLDKQCFNHTVEYYHVDIKKVFLVFNKDLLYSTGSSAEYHVTGLDGRGVWGKIDTCMCMAESLCCLPEIISTLLISYILI